MREVLPTGDIPTPRTYHAATLVDDFMFVIGGEAKIDLNDIYCLNLKTHHWVKPEIEGGYQFKAKRFHTATTFDNKIYTFGGCYGDYVYVK
jgi:N-acetylneuraminic acid mutarotase